MQCAQVIVIAGASSGIGAACALAFGRAGQAVALLFHSNEQSARDLLRQIEAEGGSGVTVQCDVSDEFSVEKGFAAIERSLGTSDVLINSAGINQSGVNVSEMDLAQWERLISTDLTGTFLTSRRFVRSLHRAGRGGAIINISSIHAMAVRAPWQATASTTRPRWPPRMSASRWEPGLMSRWRVLP